MTQLNTKITQFFTQFPTEIFSKNEYIIRTGQKNDYFFYIEKGCAKLSTTSGSGQTLVLSILYKGSCFSFLSLINQDINRYDFSTILPTTVRKVPKQDLLNFLSENPDVLAEFNIKYLKAIQGLLNRIEQSAMVSAYSQVAGLLLYFADHFSEKNSSTNQRLLEIKITHQEISEWLGLSRENVSIQMKQLERDGYIRKTEKFIEITDVTKMKKLASGVMMDSESP